MISPQGYSYGKKPQSVNPFWDEDTEPVYFKEFEENKVVTEVDSYCYFIQFYYWLMVIDLALKILKLLLPKLFL